MIHFTVSFAKIFVHSSTAADQGYHDFGEFAGFVFCLLQKIRKASSLPLVEQRKEYNVPNHSRFPAIVGKDFPSGTRVMTALDNSGSHYLRTEFRCGGPHSVEQIVNCALSTVVSRYVIGKGLSCFCPPIVVGGDDIAPF